MAEIQRSYYAIIPANVRYDEDLTPNAKLLYGEITALCNERGYCWASNAYFAELYKVSKISISNWIKQLVEKGYIHSQIKYKEGTKEILNRYLTIVNNPIKENFNTPIRKVIDPIKENFKDNNTFNNTNNIPTTTDDPLRFYMENIRYNLNPFEIQTIQHWENDYPKELVIEAMKRSVLANATGLRYTENILIDWQKKRITTLAEVERDDAAFEQRKGGKQSNAGIRQTNGSNLNRTPEEMDMLAKLRNYSSTPRTS